MFDSKIVKLEKKIADEKYVLKKLKNAEKNQKKKLAKKAKK